MLTDTVIGEYQSITLLCQRKCCQSCEERNCGGRELCQDAQPWGMFLIFLTFNVLKPPRSSSHFYSSLKYQKGRLQTNIPYFIHFKPRFKYLLLRLSCFLQNWQMWTFHLPVKVNIEWGVNWIKTKSKNIDAETHSKFSWWSSWYIKH